MGNVSTNVYAKFRCTPLRIQRTDSKNKKNNQCGFLGPAFRVQKFLDARWRRRKPPQEWDGWNQDPGTLDMDHDLGHQNIIDWFLDYASPLACYRQHLFITFRDILCTDRHTETQTNTKT